MTTNSTGHGSPGSSKGELGRYAGGEFYSGKRRTNSIGVQVEDIRICVVMVGLPARGKSLIAGKGTLHLQPLFLSSLSNASRCSRCSRKLLMRDYGKSYAI